MRNIVKSLVAAGTLLLLGVSSNPAFAASRTLSCSSGGFTGYIYLSDTRTNVRAYYKITKGSNVGGNNANVTVADGGLAPTLWYGTSAANQTGLYYFLRGPYNRGYGGYSFRFIFDKSNAVDPSCSVSVRL